MRKGNRLEGTSDYTGAIVTLALALLAFATSTAGATAVYRVDPARTVAEYTITYLGVLQQHGRFAGTTGTLAVDLDAREGHVEFTIDARSVDTGFALRRCSTSSAMRRSRSSPRGWFSPTCGWRASTGA